MANFLSQYSGAQVEEAIRIALNLKETNKVYSGTNAYWSEHSTFKGSSGDIIVVTDYALKEGKYIAGIKVADGLAYAIDLPYVTEILESQITEHIADTTVHITANERLSWNNKVSARMDTVDKENLIFTTN